MNRIKSMVINISLRHRSRMRKSLSRKLYSPPLHVVEYRKSYYHISTSLRGIFPRYQDVNRDDEMDRWCRKGMEFEEAGDLKSAIEAYTEAIERSHSNSLRALSLRGDAYQKMGEYEKAINDYTHILSINPGHIPTFISISQCHRNNNEYELAERYFEKIIELDKTNPDGYIGRAECLYLLGRLDEAKELFLKCQELFPNNKRSYFLYGRLLLSTFHIDDALENFDKLIQIDPNDSATWTSRGIALYMKKNFDLACDSFTNALNLGGPNEDLYSKRASCYLFMQKLTNAMLDCNRALSKNPNFHQVKLVRAQCFLEVGKYEEAIKDFEEFLKFTDESFPDAHLKQTELDVENIYQKASIQAQMAMCYIMIHINKINSENTKKFAVESVRIPDRHHTQTEIKEMFGRIMEELQKISNENLNKALEYLRESRKNNPNEIGIVDGLYFLKSILEFHTKKQL